MMMFSHLRVTFGELSLPGRRVLNCFQVLWSGLFGRDISLRELRGFYQLKKFEALSTTYFSTSATHRNFVEMDATFKKGYKYACLVVDG